MSVYLVGTTCVSPDVQYIHARVRQEGHSVKHYSEPHPVGISALHSLQDNDIHSRGLETEYIYISDAGTSTICRVPSPSSSVGVFKAPWIYLVDKLLNDLNCRVLYALCSAFCYP